MILRISLIIVVLMIAYLSLTPKEVVTIGNDKISHFIAYSVLMMHVGLLTYDHRKHFILGIILCIAYGALMEVGQHFVPGRYFSLYDMLANTLGVILGTFFTIVLYKPVRKILKSARII